MFSRSIEALDGMLAELPEATLPTSAHALVVRISPFWLHKLECANLFTDGISAIQSRPGAVETLSVATGGLSVSTV